MLCAVRRNGLVESLAVSRHNRQAFVVQCRFRHASTALSVANRRWIARSTSALVVYQPAARLLTTSTPPGTTKTADPKQQPILGPASPSSKPKVQLRPAPVKPLKQSPSSTETLSSSAKPSTAHNQPAESAASASNVHLSQKETIVEATKHDLEDASQHGILAPPPADASWAGRLWHQAKELLKFYLRGVKLIWSRRARVREMEERVRAGGPPLSRWETKFIQTNKRDTLKLVPFLLIAIVLEEVIPLLVLYVPGLLPSTCLLPSQKERIVTKRREKQKTFALSNRQLYEKLRHCMVVNPTTPFRSVVDSTTLSAINGLLALPTGGLDTLRMMRLQRHLKAIAEDDALLKRESYGRSLSQEQLRDVLEERGIIADGLSLASSHARLQWWLTNTQEGDPFTQRVLLVASSGAGKFS